MKHCFLLDRFRFAARCIQRWQDLEQKGIFAKNQAHVMTWEWAWTTKGLVTSKETVASFKTAFGG